MQAVDRVARGTATRLVNQRSANAVSNLASKRCACRKLKFNTLWPTPSSAAQLALAQNIDPLQASLAHLYPAQSVSLLSHSAESTGDIWLCTATTFSLCSYVSAVQSFIMGSKAVTARIFWPILALSFQGCSCVRLPWQYGT